MNCENRSLFISVWWGFLIYMSSKCLKKMNTWISRATGHVFLNLYCLTLTSIQIYRLLIAIGKSLHKERQANKHISFINVHKCNLHGHHILFRLKSSQPIKNFSRKSPLYYFQRPKILSTNLIQFHVFRIICIYKCNLFLIARVSNAVDCRPYIKTFLVSLIKKKLYGTMEIF